MNFFWALIKNHFIPCTIKTHPNNSVVVVSIQLSWDDSFTTRWIPPYLAPTNKPLIAAPLPTPFQVSPTFLSPGPRPRGFFGPRPSEPSNDRGILLLQLNCSKKAQEKWNESLLGWSGMYVFFFKNWCFFLQQLENFIVASRQNCWNVFSKNTQPKKGRSPLPYLSAVQYHYLNALWNIYLRWFHLRIKLFYL